METEQNIYQPKPPEVNTTAILEKYENMDKATLLEQYNKRQAEGRKRIKAIFNGEDIEPMTYTLEERIMNRKGYELKHGKEGLTKLLANNMSFLNRVRQKYPNDRDPQLEEMRQAVHVFLPEIMKDPRLKQIYEDSLASSHETLQAMSERLNPKFKNLPEKEQQRRTNLLAELLFGIYGLWQYIRSRKMRTSLHPQ